MGVGMRPSDHRPIRDPRAQVLQGAGVTLLGATSLKAALDQGVSQTRTGDAMSPSSVPAVDALSRAAVAASVRLAGRGAHDAITSARNTSGATMSAALSPTAACEAA